MCREVWPKSEIELEQIDDEMVEEWEGGADEDEKLDSI